jgi:hypothetical protein
VTRGQHRPAGGWFRAPRGRAAQPDGRHTPEYVSTNGADPERTDGVGMFPLGEAGRESLEQHHRAEPERGDRHSDEARATAAANRAK